VQRRGEKENMKGKGQKKEGKVEGIKERKNARKEI
jgi:hypothetical protein